MATRKAMLTALGAILGLVLAVGSVRAMNDCKLMYVTFSGPVSLPGVALGTGTYAFELLDSSIDMVRVRNKDRSQVYYTGFTNRVERPAGRQPNRPVVFGESRPGAAPPIAVWYPAGDTIGHEFIYPKKSR
jgi:hypothetical protein